MTSLAHRLFWETKGAIKFKEFFAMTNREKAFYIASLSVRNDEIEKAQKEAKRRRRR